MYQTNDRMKMIKNMLKIIIIIIILFIRKNYNHNSYRLKYTFNYLHYIQNIALKTTNMI